MSIYVDAYLELRVPGGEWQVTPLYRKDKDGEMHLASLLYGQSWLKGLVDALQYEDIAVRIGRDAVSKELYQARNLKECEYTACYKADVNAFHKYANRSHDRAGWVSLEEIENFEKHGGEIEDVLSDADLLEHPKLAEMIRSHRKYYTWVDPEGPLIYAKSLQESVDAVSNIFFWSDLDIFEWGQEVDSRIIFLVD